MLQQALDGRRGARGHRRRQVDEPARVDGEAGHRLERGGAVLRADRHASGDARVQPQRSGDVVEVEQRVALLLAGGAGGGPQRLGQLLGRLGPGAFGRYGYQLALGPAQRRQAPTEGAAGVDADRVVDPLGASGRRVAVDHGRAAAVVLRPVEAHRQALVVGLAGGLAVEAEVAHLARGAVLQLFLHAGVGDDEPSAVEHVVARQPVEELRHAFAELLGRCFQLLHRLGESVLALDVAAGERAGQLRVVVAGDRQRVSCLDHVHDQSQRPGAVGPAVDQVADEDGGAARWRCGVVAGADAGVVARDAVAELHQQGFELAAAGVDVPDDVERARQVPPVAVDRLAHDLGFAGALGRAQAVAPAEALGGQLLHPALHRPPLAAHRVRGTCPGAAGRVLCEAVALAQVEGDGAQRGVLVARELDVALAVFGRDVGGVDDGEPPGAQAPGGDLADDVEGVLCRRGVALVVADDAAVVVRGEDLGRAEVFLRERRLSGPAGADEDDEPVVVDLQLHRWSGPGAVVAVLVFTWRSGRRAAPLRACIRSPRPRRRDGSTRPVSPRPA